MERAGRLVGGWNATGGCSHAAIWENISSNLTACEELIYRDLTSKETANNLSIPPLILCKSGGDNLAENFTMSTQQKRKDAQQVYLLVTLQAF